MRSYSYSFQTKISLGCSTTPLSPCSREVEHKRTAKTLGLGAHTLLSTSPGRREKHVRHGQMFLQASCSQKSYWLA